MSKCRNCGGVILPKKKDPYNLNHVIGWRKRCTCRFPNPMPKFLSNYLPKRK